ncbi:DUF4328 domain-containing protein [Streptomyces sp. NPDC051940]|uniref:DUF4328 domain-containing protein n=1 Tax=Streptomyces sp. NPDC051940 TaxID=3155675 RepID=UPI0034354A6D
MLCSTCGNQPATTPDGRCADCAGAEAPTLTKDAAPSAPAPEPAGFGEAPTAFNTPRDGRTTPYDLTPPQQPGGPGYAGQPQPGTPYAGQPQPGMPYAGQPQPGMPYAGQPPHGMPYAGQPAYGYPPPPSFSRLGGLAVALYALLGLCMAADVFSLFAGAHVRSLLDRIETATDSEIDAADGLYGLTGVLQLIALVATGVVFIVWFFKARKNAELFDASVLRHSPGWAIGGWFIPIGNFFIPKKIANDVWQASTPPPPGGTWQVAKTGLVTGWWALFVASTIIDRFSATAYNNAEEPDALSDAIGQMMLADVLDIAAAVLAILFVRKLTSMQEVKHSLGLTPGSGIPPYPVQGGYPQGPSY